MRGALGTNATHKAATRTTYGASQLAGRARFVQPVSLTSPERGSDHARLHPDCFFEGLRLVGVDGPQFSVLNTPVLLAQLPKAATRRLEALCYGAPGERGGAGHSRTGSRGGGPGRRGGEQTLARRLWEKLRQQSLTIIDRLLGTAATLSEPINASSGRNCYFLARIRENIKHRRHDCRTLGGWQRLVDVPVRENGKVVKVLRVREIRPRGVSREGKRLELRLWTTMLDGASFAAQMRSPAATPNAGRQGFTSGS